MKKEKDRNFTLKSKVSSKPIIKVNKMEVHIPDKKIESSWDDENRFFKGEFEKEKKLFFT